MPCDVIDICIHKYVPRKRYENAVWDGRDMLIDLKNGTVENGQSLFLESLIYRFIHIECVCVCGRDYCSEYDSVSLNIFNADILFVETSNE